ncbi:MAG TPA: hypothetical protein PKE29_03090 [Phycisphaerales bacterium]|nr:hypothetical protein [Phycisphaerales bacterium]
MASTNDKKKTPAAAPSAPAAKPPTQMQLILAAQAKKKAEKEAKAKSRPAPSSRGLGSPLYGSPGSVAHGNTHAKGGATGVTRRTAPGG